MKSSQGFDWNQGTLSNRNTTPEQEDAMLTALDRSELFLPSYANHFDAQQLEHKQDPVHDIVLSEEDAAEMLPK